ncbi:MAG: pitrilysin family protein [Candidatus ainarchaeum sp.]|nr:pitrilysin family protein [Candidatus ainarchaeum sp.]
MKIDSFKLKNDLEVIYLNKDTNSVSIVATVHAGTKNEDETNNGVAHFLEHMLFEGTKKRINGSIIAEDVASIGGIMNAQTSSILTQYFVIVPKEKFLEGLEILSDMIQNPIFDDDAILKEKKVVLNEIDLCDNDVTNEIEEKFLTTCFSSSPEHKKILGTKESLTNLTKEQIINFYKKFYVPNNMSLAIVGNIDNICKNVENYFTFTKQSLENENFNYVPNTTENNFVEFKSDKTTCAKVILGYPTVSRTNSDFYALSLIESIFDKGVGGKLINEVRIKKGLSYDVGVDNKTNQFGGHFTVEFSSDKENVSIVLEIIQKCINELNEITEIDLEKARNYIKGYFCITSDNPIKLGLLLGEYNYSTGSVAEFNNILKEYDKITINDIIRVKEKYFNNATKIVCLPKD